MLKDKNKQPVLSNNFLKTILDLIQVLKHFRYFGTNNEGSAAWFWGRQWPLTLVKLDIIIHYFYCFLDLGGYLWLQGWIIFHLVDSIFSSFLFDCNIPLLLRGLGWSLVWMTAFTECIIVYYTLHYIIQFSQQCE